jgi:cysteine desulfurase/selenocysteine lyase
MTNLNQFSIPDCIFVDSASSTQKPQCVLDAMTEFDTLHYANVHRGLYERSEYATQAYEKARETVAKLINADQKELIFTSGTTDAINAITKMIVPLLAKHPNKRTIAVSAIEHHANLVPWQQFAKQHDCKLIFIEYDDTYHISLEDAKEKLTDDVLVFAFTHCSNVFGTIQPVQELCTIAKDKNILTVIDGAQAAPHMPVDVKTIDCDFYAFSSHKLCGPTGIGALYGKYSVLEHCVPFRFGGNMILEVTYDTSSWNSIPQRFEAGTPPITQAIGFSAAVDFIQPQLAELQLHEKELTRVCLEQLNKLEEVTVFPTDTGIISFTVKGIHPHDVAGELAKKNICIRGGHHCAMPLMKRISPTGTARISFYIYNSLDQIDPIINAIKETITLFS